MLPCGSPPLEPGLELSSCFEGRQVYSPLHSKLKAHLAMPYAAAVARRLLDEDPAP